jgi:hypothetical protein
MCEHFLVDWEKGGPECVWGEEGGGYLLWFYRLVFGCSEGGLFYYVFTTRPFLCHHLYLFWHIGFRDLFGSLRKSNPLYYF